MYIDSNHIDNNIIEVEKLNMKIIKNRRYFFIQINKHIKEAMEIKKNIKFSIKIKVNGLYEKPIIPSLASLIIFLRLYFVSPAYLALRS